MARILITGVNIIDGGGTPPYRGQVLIEGERIATVAPIEAMLAARDAERIDGHGATLMPGLIESHAHLSFTDIVMGTDLGNIPPEEQAAPAGARARRRTRLADHHLTTTASLSRRHDRYALQLEGARCFS